MNQVTAEGIIAMLTLAGAMIAGYVKLMTKIKELEIRLLQVEKQDDKILTKLDSITETLNEIKVDLQNKQDK